MKRFIKNLLLVVLVVTATACLAFGLAACDGDNLQSISIVDAKVEFRVGDEFEYGDYFKVYANYKDGTQEDVTEEVQIRKENGFDMNAAGNYQITVSYGNKKEVYTIYVGAFDNVLRKLEVEGAKTQFKLGESISYDGIKLTATYENAQGALIKNVFSSLREFNVAITDENGIAIEEVFPQFGNYTVTISRGSVKTSYVVTVADVDISTVQGAIAVGTAFQKEVLSGTLKYNSGIHGSEPTPSADYEYKFGDNYTYYLEKHNTPNQHMHMSLDEEGFFYVQIENGNMTTNPSAQSSMVGGVPIQLWYYQSTEYGIESALNNLYRRAEEATNKDLKETADENKKEYSFSFSGLEYRGNNYDYYETEVSFTLGGKNNIASVEITQSYWENNSGNKDVPGYEPTFITDEKTNITKSNMRYSEKINVICNQLAGERTETNPYSREMFKITSYDLLYKGQKLDDNAVIACRVADENLAISIDNVMPKDAGFDLDLLYLNYEGSNLEDSSIYVICDGFYAYRDDITNSIRVNLYNGGVWKLILKTALTTKTITLDITGVAPTAMTAQVRNEATKTFYASATKIIALNGEVYFYGAVNQYANAAQTAQVISGNAVSCAIEEIKADGLKYYKFTATQMGEYKVKVTSDVAANVSVTFTFTVSDIPDYAELLQGKYTLKDLEENIYEVAFTPAASADGEISGTVVIKKTPTELDGTPITAETKTVSLLYSVDVENFAIILTQDSGEDLGVALLVNASGALMLEDQYGDMYELTKSN